jgi:NAD(P)H-dependent FMN reductase
MTNSSLATDLAGLLRLAVVVGSTRDGRRGRDVADWYVGAIAGDDRVIADVVDLADIELPDRYTFHPHDGVAELRARLDRADAFVVVTPEYNHSYPASLKDAIDYAKAEWFRKAIAFVSYGGVSGGLRAVEHLRGVFAELHAVGIRETVSFHGPFNGFGDDGPGDPESASQAAQIQLDDLVWWATTLRSGRDRVLEAAW